MASKTPEERMAALEAERDALAAELKAKHSPAVEEINEIMDDDMKAKIARIAELGATLPQMGQFSNLRMMTYSLGQAFGGVANTLLEARK